VEGDEFAIVKRKYEKGKRQRSAGVAWVQSILEVEQSPSGKSLLRGCVPRLFLQEMHLHYIQTSLKQSLLVLLSRRMVGLRIRV